ncbi:MAG: cysteine rich repeat-containing protein [Afipia sp.]
MYRICLVAVALSLPTLASAQEITAAQRAACKSDYEKYCSNVMPGGGRIVACLSKESAKLTDACKAALSAAQAK